MGSVSVEREIGRRVAEERQRIGLTQAALAERLGLASETVSRLERGAALPSVSRLARVAEALGVELRDLLTFSRQRTRKDQALARLISIARRRPVEDIDMMADIAGRIFERWK